VQAGPWVTVWPGRMGDMNRFASVTPEANSRRLTVTVGLEPSISSEAE